MKNALDRYRRYLRLLGRHGLSLARAFFVLSIVRTCLTFQSYRTVMAWIERTPVRPGNGPAIPVLVWSILHSAKIVPGATCLTQALSLRYFLTKTGEESAIRIGVRQAVGKPLDAHAWVIYKGRVLIGGSDTDLQGFNTLIDL